MSGSERLCAIENSLSAAGSEWWSDHADHVGTDTIYTLTAALIAISTHSFSHYHQNKQKFGACGSLP